MALDADAALAQPVTIQQCNFADGGSEGGATMTRVLMVYHDAEVADIEADELRRNGYEVDRCAGPIGGAPCPVLHGKACWQADRADVLVYDTFDSELHGENLVASLRAMHPNRPLVLTSSGQSSTDATRSDVRYAPTRASLIGAIEEALHAPNAAPAATTDRSGARAYAGPRW
jgi:hypothetical protein